MVMYYHEAMCLAEKLVHYLQCQGHSEGLYNQNTTISTISSKLLVRLQPNLTLIVHRDELECHMEKFGHCGQGQGHSKGSKCQ